MEPVKTYDELVKENANLSVRLEEATETIEAIRTGQIDALWIHGKQGHQLYTLKTADQTYRVFIEKMTEGAVTLNHDGVIIYSNSQFAATLNIPLSKVLGENFKTFIATDCIEQFEALFLKSWKQDCKGEVTLSGKNRNIPFQLSLTTLVLDDGISLSIILTDLTAQKEAQKKLTLNNLQLEKSNHALELSNNDLQQFASVASHDLQEPLRKIRIYSSLIKLKYSNELSDDARECIEKIISSSSRMSTLILDILNYSKLSSDDIVFEHIDLKQIITELLDDYEVTIKEKNAVITVEDLPIIQANLGQLRQVFQNLISNSLKFSKSEVPPVISIKQVDLSHETSLLKNQKDVQYCFISVKDNGIGFNEKYTENIFTLFQRLHNKDKYEGTGIGLSITKKIIEKHNGVVLAKSKEGEGAEFILVLPVKQAI